MRKTTTTTTSITTSSTNIASGTTATTTTTVPQWVMNLPSSDRDLTASRIIIENMETSEDVEDELPNIVGDLLDGKKESSFIRREQVINVFNISGDNARVYIKSKDRSENVYNVSSEDVFIELRERISEGVGDSEERSVLMYKINELEQAKGTSSFALKYSEFISLAANHLALITPILPALTQWLIG